MTGTAFPFMTTNVYGKWILAGEHAVLRGCPALVFPAFSRSLELSFSESGQPLSADFKGETGRELQLLFWGVMEKGLEMVGRSINEVTGRFQLVNSVPIGAGLGASATLCVATGRWFVWKNWVLERDLYEFARQLENLFHGESSGVDIAVAISGKGLHFEREGARYEVEPRWRPHWYLSYSGKRGVTHECVARVKALGARDPGTARSIDQDMREAVRMAEQALLTMSESRGFEQLADSIHKARSCFDRWGLTGGEAGQHLSYLLSKGAVAVKPTGSGDGGFALSLWRTVPPADLALLSLGGD